MIEFSEDHTTYDADQDTAAYLLRGLSAVFFTDADIQANAKALGEQLKEFGKSTEPKLTLPTSTAFIARVALLHGARADEAPFARLTAAADQQRLGILIGHKPV
jgi:hypothetical protein